MTVTTSLKKAPEVATLGLSLCVPLGYKFFLSYCHYSICSSGMQYSQNENLMIYLWLFSTQGKMAYCGISATLFIPVMRSALDNFHAVSVYLKYYPVFSRQCERSNILQGFRLAVLAFLCIGTRSGRYRSKACWFSLGFSYPVSASRDTLPTLHPAIVFSLFHLYQLMLFQGALARTYVRYTSFQFFHVLLAVKRVCWQFKWNTVFPLQLFSEKCWLR